MSGPAPTTGLRVLFVDRDGTLIEEPPDQQIDAFHKLRLVPQVIPALLRLQAVGYRIVLVSNQDGLGTDRFPEPNFRGPHELLRQILASQGIRIEAELICPHLPEDDCRCRKPRTGLVDDYLDGRPLDREGSAVIGDRDTDLELARNLGVTGMRVGPGGLSWSEIADRLCPGARRAEVTRRTRETDVEVRVDLRAEGPVAIATGLGFFDHMLEQIARHGGFALELRCRGDLHVDEHHTVEDCALALGDALRRALGDKRGIGRYGFVLPMDESQAQVALDLSGRPYAVFEGSFGRERVGELPTELVPHFFRSLAESLGAALHVQVRGDNSHHMIEACFKAVGRALRQAIRVEGDAIPSSKGVL